MRILLFTTCVVPLLLLFIPYGSSEIKPLQGKIISGIYHEEIQKFVPYTKVVPMLFEFKLKPEYGNAKSSTTPSFPSSQSSGFPSYGTTNSNNAFQILPRLNCRSDVKFPVLNTVDWYFTCPVMYHLNNFIQALRNNLTDIYPTPSSTLPSPRSQTMSSLGPQEAQRFTNSRIKFEECESVVEKMWKGITNRERDTGFAFYSSIVEKCSSLPIHVEAQISDEIPDYTEFFDMMQHNFVSTFFLNSSDPGELVNNLIGLQGLHLQSIYSELTRVREAVLSCQNNMIPQSFLKYSRLEKGLTELRPKLLRLRHSVSTPSISKLYKMPIADCIFAGNSLIVQILLPVVRSDLSYALLRVNNPFFLYENRLCKVEPGKSSGQIISDDEPPTKYYLYERNTKAVVSTECTPGDTNLCQISDQTSRPMINRCMTSVLNQSLLVPDNVRYYCNLKCESEPLSDAFSKLILPIIQRISTSKFVVAVNRITTLLIKCEGKPDELVSPQEYGAVEISLACGCYLMWHSEKFEARVPCANTVVIRHVVPEQMLNRSAVYSRNKFYFVSNLGERINSSLVTKGVNVSNAGFRDASFVTGMDEEGNTEIPSEIFTFENANINESLVGAFTNSLSLANQTATQDGETNGYSFYKAGCYNGGVTHTFLWVAVTVETALFFGVAMYLYCRIHEMDKRWDLRDRTAVTYSSAAQLTNVYD